MTPALRAVGIVLDAVAAVFRAAIAFILLAMLTINAVNIFWRGASGTAFDWVFHWTILMFVWMVCLGFYVYMRANRDVVVEVFAKRLPGALRRALAIGADMIGLVFTYMVLSPAARLVSMQTGDMETIALPIWVRSLPLFLAAAFLTVHFAVHALQVALGEIDPFASQDQPEAELGAPE